MRFMQGVFLFALCLLLAFGACRRNQPSLIDRNQAPNTELWYAPPDSTEYEYLVHLYWRGLDNDGTVQKYIWTIEDTLVVGELVWTPSERLRDFRSGRIINKTDSVFAFSAFRNVGGVGLKKNRQAFHIAAIDDNGIIDDTPAAMEFVATIDALPQMFFSTVIGGTPVPFNPPPIDTVGMFNPFSITYHGATSNGALRAYRWFPLSQSIILEGADEWTDDLSDTVRVFANVDEGALPAGVFRFVAQCRDDANAESAIDAGTFERGVAQVVVNFDPDTQFNDVKNFYTKNNAVIEEEIDFRDSKPDTVPYQSWITMWYSGWDDSRDVQLCGPVAIEPDRCIDFQVKYRRNSQFPCGGFEDSGWLPRAPQVHDTDPSSATDSNSVNVGSLNYDFFARSIDENAQPDGTPPKFRIIGSFDPTLDSLALEDHLGNRIDMAQHDTLTWNWWKGVGWPYSSQLDTLQFDIITGEVNFIKRFYWELKGWGHDHPKDPDGSGIKSWRYIMRNGAGNIVRLGLSGDWIENLDDGGDIIINRLDDRFQLTVRYNSSFETPPDPFGDVFWNDRPSWLDDDYTVEILARDTPAISDEFEQYIFVNGNKVLVNSFQAACFGRRTETRTFSFHFRMVRPGMP